MGRPLSNLSSTFTRVRYQPPATSMTSARPFSCCGRGTTTYLFYATVNTLRVDICIYKSILCLFFLHRRARHRQARQNLPWNPPHPNEAPIAISLLEASNFPADALPIEKQCHPLPCIPSRSVEFAGCPTTLFSSDTCYTIEVHLVMFGGLLTRGALCPT